MKNLYSLKALLFCSLLFPALHSAAQTPTTVTQGVCSGVIADFNTNDNGFNSPSIYGSIFDSSFYFNGSRGYWTDYLPPTRVNAPGFIRVQNIISPPYSNPNPTGTFNVGFTYIVNDPVLDRFQVRIISVTQTSMGTVSNVEATSGVQSFAAWSTPSPYIDNGPNPTPFLNGFQGNICIRLIDPDIQNGPSTNFRVEVSYIINEAFFAVFDNLSIGPVNIPLPVNFIGLVANRTPDDLVNLKWDVSEEVNVLEYQVEKSDNGSQFSTAGSLAAKGKSIYTFNNAVASSNTVFYRIKSVDIDGRFKYSGIVKLSGSASNSYVNGLMIYPQPARDQITIAHKKLARDARMVILSTQGTIMKNINLATGSSHTYTNVGGLAPGMYFIRLVDAEGNVETVKLLKN